MNRWLALLEEVEKTQKRSGGDPPKPPKPPQDEVLGVLSVPRLSKSVNFAEARTRSDQVANLATRSADPPPPPVSHPVGWLPEPSPGVTILRPGVELPAAGYDARISAMLEALPDGSPEAKRLDFARRKGWVIDCDGERIFTRGRT